MGPPRNASSLSGFYCIVAESGGRIAPLIGRDKKWDDEVLLLLNCPEARLWQ